MMRWTPRTGMPRVWLRNTGLLALLLVLAGISLGIGSVSIGVAGQPPLNGSQQALLQADAALYRAKASGRNRVCVWDAEPERG